MDKVKEALSQDRINSIVNSGHSFHIEAAMMTAAKQGLSEATISKFWEGGRAMLKRYIS